MISGKIYKNEPSHTMSLCPLNLTCIYQPILPMAYLSMNLNVVEWTLVSKMFVSPSAKLAVSVCYVLYLALSMLVCPNHQSMRFFQFSFRAMEQIRTGTLLDPHPVGGCLIVVNETEAQKTRSALALLDILKIGTHARSRETWEVGKQLLDFQILIISLLMSFSIGRRLRSSLLKLRLSPLYILTPPRYHSISKSIHFTLEFYIFIV